MTDLDFQTIGKQIRKRRRECGLTQEAVAERLDVNPSHISNIENGRANPSLTILVKLANVLECSVDFFISHEYTYKDSDTRAQEVNEKLMSKLASFDLATKEKILKIMDLL
jgi:transcriptional regulator with XRE-family HTH domain